MTLSITESCADIDWGFYWTPWQTVTAYKKNAAGNYIVDSKTGQPRVFSFSLDKLTGMLYNGSDDHDDPRAVVALKCAILTVLNPMYAFGNVAWHFGSACVQNVQWTVGFLKTLHTAAQMQDVSTTAKSFFKGFFWELPQQIGGQIWKIARVVIYHLGMEFAYFYGLINPYAARKCAAHLECRLHNGVSWKQDYRMQNAPEDLGCFKANLEDIQNAKVFYLAFCFIPKYHIDDSRLVILNR